MKAEEPLRLLRDPDAFTRTELIAYRVLAGIGTLCVVGFRWAHLAADPDAFDPLFLRLAVGGVCMLIVIASFLLRRRAFLRVLHAGFYVVTLWVLALVVWNQFSPEFTLAFLVVIGAVAASFDSTRRLLVYYGVSLGLLFLFAALATEPRVSLITYLPYTTVLCGLSYIGLTARLRSSEAHAQSEERYALAAYGANDGLWDWDLRGGDITITERFAEMMGDDTSVLQRNPSALLGRVHEDDREHVRAAVATCRHGHASHFSVEYRMSCADGVYRWMQLRGAVVRDEARGTARLAGSQTDIDARKRAEQQVLHDALHDRLTELPNRALLNDRLKQLLSHIARHGSDHFAMLFLDIDRFKLVNDGLGHAVGDQLLNAVARRLESTLRAEDTLARLGADDFVMLLRTDGADEALRIARRAIDLLARPIQIDEHELFVSASVGITLSTLGYRSGDDILRDADTALHRAKRRGPGSIELFDEEMHREAVAALRLETELRRALDGGELRVHYQPIVDLDTRAIVGFEALLRWQHPVLGLLGPDAFIKSAEDTGLIVPVGRWVLREACNTARRWNDASDEKVFVSVNLSPQQFTYEQLSADVHEAIADAGIGPELLKLEITESALLRQTSIAENALDSFRASGVRVCIDDFGTGYASLSYLHRMEVDTLKIDRSFVSAMHESGKDHALVRTVLLLASSAGLDTIAEGIETTEQLNGLTELGCRHGQGFLFTCAVADDASIALVREQPYLAIAGN